MVQGTFCKAEQKVPYIYSIDAFDGTLEVVKRLLMKPVRITRMIPAFAADDRKMVEKKVACDKDKMREEFLSDI